MNAMNHEQAMQTQAAERYLLGELDGPEREAYEEHFFGCAVCAEEVSTGADFVRAAHDYFVDEPRPFPVEPKPFVPAWLSLRNLLRPVPAFALGLALGVSALVVRNATTHRSPQVITEAFLTESRSGELKTIQVSKDREVALRFEIPPRGDFNGYQAQIVTEMGKVESSSPISAQQAKEAVYLLVDAATLSPGRYFLVIQGVNDKDAAHGPLTEVARYAFDLKFQR